METGRSMCKDQHHNVLLQQLVWTKESGGKKPASIRCCSTHKNTALSCHLLLHSTLTVCCLTVVYCFITEQVTDTCCSLTWTTASTSGNEFWVGGTGGKRQKRWWAGASDSIWRSLGEFWRVKTYQKVEELFQKKSVKVQCNVSSWLLNNSPFSEFKAIKKLGTSTILMDEEAHRQVHGCYTTRQHLFFSGETSRSHVWNKFSFFL